MQLPEDEVKDLISLSSLRRGKKRQGPHKKRPPLSERSGFLWMLQIIDLRIRVSIWAVVEVMDGFGNYCEEVVLL